MVLNSGLRSCLIIIIVSAACLLGQLMTGTHPGAALMLTGAATCGMFAVTEAGGITTVAGLLSAVMVTRYLLAAIALKTLMGSSTDGTLDAPVHTPAVMLVGFFGLLIGVIIQRHLPRPKIPPIPEPRGAQMYLALTIVLFVFGYGGYFALEHGNAEIRTGGIWGLFHAISPLKSFCIVPALLYAWARGGKRFMTHPLVLLVLFTGAIVGVFTTSKQGAMEPLVFYVAVAAMRYGIRDRRLVALGVSGFLYYAAVIYPYAQYSRGNGGREGDLLTRITAVKQIFWLMLTDPNYRSAAQTANVDPMKSNYFDNVKMEPFNRFAMIGEADRLVYATDAQGAFTGWETIVWGFTYMIPSFIYKDKPIWGTANFLAQITGDVSMADTTTQVSFGVMANFYNAFGLNGVFWGSIGFFAVFLYSCLFWFGDIRIGGLHKGGSIWALLLVANFHHQLVEEPFASLMPSMELPGVVLFLYLLSKYIAKLLPGETPKRAPDIRRIPAY
jgi:hypothetical protein